MITEQALHQVASIRAKRQARKVAALLKVYGDESSDETHKRVYAVAGLIANVDTWEKAEIKWIERTSGIPFHANHCESDRGVYVHSKHAENQSLYKDLTVLLADSGIIGWGAIIDMNAMVSVFPNCPDLVHVQCLRHVVQDLRYYTAKEGEKVDFTFDNRVEIQHNATEAYRILRAMEQWDKEIGPTISFACSLDEPRIQMADLYARECMKEVDNVVGPVLRGRRKSMAALLETERFGFRVLDLDYFNELKEALPELERRSGISTATYARWLKQNKLDHNSTNVLKFAEWSEAQPTNRWEEIDKEENR